MKFKTLNKRKDLLKFRAYTVIELIVAIVILGILATIALLSFLSYSASARDSIRMSDLRNISKGLVLNDTITGKYPIPDNKVDILSGSYLIGFQGYAGDQMMNVIKLSNGGKDPLDHAYYTYNTNPLTTKYQLLAFLENGDSFKIGYFPTIDKVYAENYDGRYPYGVGDKLGVVIIMTGSKDSYTPLQDLKTDFDLSTDSGASFFIGNDQYLTGSREYIAYSYMGSGSLLKDYADCNAASYSGFEITPLLHGETKNFIKPIDNGTGSLTVSCEDGILSYGIENYSCNSGYVEQGGACVMENCSGTTPIGGKISNSTSLTSGTWHYSTTPGVCTYSCDINYTWNNGSQTCDPNQKIFECSDSKPANSEWNTVSSYSQTWNGSDFLPADTPTLYDPEPSTTDCNFKCKDGYLWDEGTHTCRSTYPSCDSDDIKLNNGQIWAACNVGSTTSGTGSASYGNYFQWGFNDGTWSSDTYNRTSGTWPLGGQGPCAAGYHVPTQDEWTAACNEISGNGCASSSNTVTAIRNKLLMPASGYYSSTSSAHNFFSTYNYYWLSNPYTSASSYILRFSSSIIGNYTIGKNYWLPVRCIKNRCDENYYWDPAMETCLPSTIKFFCPALPPNTVQNSVTSYLRTWDGSDFLPLASTYTYDTDPSTTSCRYKCSSGFHTEDGSSCISNTRACNLELTNWSSTQTWSGGAWGSCNVIGCNSGYTLSGGTCIPKCDSNTPNFTAIGSLTQGTPTTPNQAWTYSATPGNCTYTCAYGYAGTGCIDSKPPTITGVRPYTQDANDVGFVIEGYSDNYATTDHPYSWDGGVTWLRSNDSRTNYIEDGAIYKNPVPSGSGSFTLKAGMLKVRDAVGNIYSNPTDIVGTSDYSLSAEYGPLNYSGAIDKCASLGAGWKVPVAYDFSMGLNSCTTWPRGANCIYPSYFSTGKIYWTQQEVWSGGNYNHIVSLAKGSIYNDSEDCDRNYNYCRSSSYTNKGSYGSSGSMYVRCIKYNNPR